MNQSINRRLTALNVSDAPIEQEYDDSLEEQQDNIFVNGEVCDVDGNHVGHISELRMDDIYLPGIIGQGGASSSSGFKVGVRFEFKVIVESTLSSNDLWGRPIYTGSCNVGKMESFQSSYHPINGSKVRIGIVWKYMCDPGHTYSDESLRKLYMGEPLNVSSSGESSSGDLSSGPSLSSSSSISEPSSSISSTPSQSMESSSSSSSSSSFSSSSSSERGGESARGSPGGVPIVGSAPADTIDDLFRQVLLNMSANSHENEPESQDDATLDELDADFGDDFSDVSSPDNGKKVYGVFH